MSDVPFGFGSSDRGAGDNPDDGGSGSGGLFGFGGFNPFGGPGGELPDDLAGKIPLFAELQKLMSWSGGPVNWDLARQIALSALAQGHQIVPIGDRAAVTEALRLADHWLDEATALPSGVTTAEAWSRVEWVERTIPVWSALCDPVAARVSSAMATSLPEEMRAQAGPLAGMLNQIGGMMFGAQIGQALGGLAGEVLGASDIGLPLGPAGVGALVPENVAAFGRGLGRPEDEVRLYLALREAAHQRLFAHVPWLRQRLLDSVDAYARGIVVDASAIERAITGMDPTNPEAMQEALAGGLFEPQTTPEQQAVLARLETLLALVEGWVDAVVTSAAAPRLQGADALRETSRRRRATGGPAEHTFATLVGLELRPRRLRDAAALWSAIEAAGGAEARDRLWSHPDLMPSADDLDDPAAFAARSQADQVGADIFADMFADKDALTRDPDADADGSVPGGSGPDDGASDDSGPTDRPGAL
jgi:putative hydrolase